MATGVPVMAWKSSCMSGVQAKTALQLSSTDFSMRRSFRQVPPVIGRCFR